MGFKCLFSGHKWEMNCSYCSVCGKKRPIEHNWKGCVCINCKTTRHEWLYRICIDCSEVNNKASWSSIFTSFANGSSARNMTGETELITSSREGSLLMVKDLIKNGSKIHGEINDGDNSAKSALWMASCYGHVEIVNELINAGANIEMEDKDGWTSLMCASYYGKIKVVNELIKAGADIEAINRRYGKNSLILACKNGHIEIIKALIKSGANIETKDNRGYTALGCIELELREGKLSKSKFEEIKIILLEGKNVSAEILENNSILEPLKNDISKDNLFPKESEDVKLVCKGCNSHYILGKDTTCLTSEEMADMMPGLVGSFEPHLLVSYTKNIGSQHLKRLQEDAETIKHLGPSRGWQCEKCKTHNTWEYKQ